LNLLVEPILTPTEEKKDAPRGRHIRRKLDYQSGQRCECCSCREHFNKTATFEAHRVGSFGRRNTRRCLTIEEMKGLGYTKTQDDYWLAPMSEKDREYFKARKAKT